MKTSAFFLVLFFCSTAFAGDAAPVKTDSLILQEIRYTVTDKNYDKTKSYSKKVIVKPFSLEDAKVEIALVNNQRDEVESARVLNKLAQETTISAVLQKFPNEPITAKGRKDLKTEDAQNFFDALADKLLPDEKPLDEEVLATYISEYFWQVSISEKKGHISSKTQRIKLNTRQVSVFLKLVETADIKGIVEEASGKEKDSGDETLIGKQIYVSQPKRGVVQSTIEVLYSTEKEKLWVYAVSFAADDYGDYENQLAPLVKNLAELKPLKVTRDVVRIGGCMNDGCCRENAHTQEVKACKKCGEEGANCKLCEDCSKKLNRCGHCWAKGNAEK